MPQSLVLKPTAESNSFPSESEHISMPQKLGNGASLTSKTVAFTLEQQSINDIAVEMGRSFVVGFRLRRMSSSSLDRE
jgi:hypothetical protein